MPRLLYISVDGDSRGPFTTDQIYNMWNNGEIPANSLYFNEEKDEWQPLLDTIDSFKPLSGIQKVIGTNKPTEEQQNEANKSVNKGCGCLLLICAIAVLFMGYASFELSRESKVTETTYTKEPVRNPKPVYRDIYKVYSPEEEREYQQKVLDSQFELKKTETTRDKTDGEMRGERTTSIIIFIVGVVLLISGFRVYSRKK